jgi:hypothetical protein
MCLGEGTNDCRKMRRAKRSRARNSRLNAKISTEKDKKAESAWVIAKYYIAGIMSWHSHTAGSSVNM